MCCFRLMLEEQEIERKLLEARKKKSVATKSVSKKSTPDLVSTESNADLPAASITAKQVLQLKKC